MSKSADLKSASEFVRRLIDSAPIAYCLLDRDYRMLYFNERFATLRGFGAGTAAGEKCYAIANGGVRCVKCAVTEAFATGERALLHRKDVLPGGKARFIDDYAVPIKTGASGTDYVLEIMVDRTQESLAHDQRNADYDEILALLCSLLEAKDAYTATHSDSVRKLAVNLATALGLPLDDIFEISIAASLHDLGKLHIPDSIINKPGKLTVEEYNVVKTHPAYSCEMLAGLSSFQNIRHIVRHHHERTDGDGYPDGLSGGDIPIGARIIAVADTYDAITSTRCYRSALSHEYALAEIRRVAGTQLDALIADIFVNMDFSRLICTAYAPNGQTAQRRVERILPPPQSGAPAAASAAIVPGLDRGLLLHEIFQNTPCGYALVGRGQNIVYANHYFLGYLGVTRAQLSQMRCCDILGCADVCGHCPFAQGAPEKSRPVRQKVYTAAGMHFFDLYSIPALSGPGGTKYVAEIVLDRTEEVLFQLLRQRDFKRLVEIFGDILRRAETGSERRKLSDKIIALQARVDGLLQQKAI